ncbi:MAG: hypothetical protein VX589_15545 [Myxococcota bacterium]|nr:hypothetical protein [Myxococcota bacterium]
MHPLFAIVLPGLERVAADEIKRCGFEQVNVVKGGIEFVGRPALANVMLGCPTRILLRVGQFKARSFAQLEKGIKALPLAGFGGVTPHARCRKSKLYHTKAIEERVAQWVSPGPLSLLIRIERDRCTVSVDTSGDRLHRRGWRTEQGPAPLRETIAHAFLRWAGWTPGQALLDPMCGAGTIPIEAAIWAHGRWPGAGRTFPCHQWTDIRTPEPRSEVQSVIHGSDKDASMVEMASRNAVRAGVSIHWSTMEAKAVLPPAPTGLLLGNPPYGKRIHDADPYGQLGTLLKGAFRGWDAAIIVPHQGAIKRLGRRPSKRLRLRQGGHVVEWVYLAATDKGERIGRRDPRADGPRPG